MIYQRPVDGVATIHEEALLHFQRQFDLDDEQVQAIDRVFRLHQEAVDSSWQVFRPHVLSAIDSVHAHIESILGPGQRETFRAWVAGQSVGLMHETHGIGSSPILSLRPPDARSSQ